MYEMKKSKGKGHRYPAIDEDCTGKCEEYMEKKDAPAKGKEFFKRVNQSSY